MKFYSPILLGVLLLLIGCKDDDSLSCTTCNSPETVAFELCRNGDGNAVVNGEDTATDYDMYRDDLAATGVSCGFN